MLRVLTMSGFCGVLLVSGMAAAEMRPAGAAAETPSPISEGLPYPPRPAELPAAGCPRPFKYISGLGSTLQLTLKQAGTSVEITASADVRLRRPDTKAYISLDGKPALVLDLGTSGSSTIGFVALEPGPHILATAPYMKDEKRGWLVFPAHMSFTCFSIEESTSRP